MRRKHLTLIVLLLPIFVGGVYVYENIVSNDQSNDTNNEITNSAQATNNNDQRVVVRDSNEPIVEEKMPPTVGLNDVKKVSAGLEYSLIDGSVTPTEYSDKVLDSDPIEYTGELVWAYVSEAIDAGSLEQLSVETICKLTGESTGCPYLYFQTSGDLENWTLLSVSNESPPRIGRTTYVRDLSKFNHGQYYRYVLHSKECEQINCRSGSGLFGSYDFELSVTFN